MSKRTARPEAEDPPPAKALRTKYPGLCRALAAEARRCRRGLDGLQILCLRRFPGRDEGDGREHGNPEDPQELLRAAAEECDCVTRLDGETAALLSPGADPDALEAWARRVLARKAGEGGGLAALLCHLPGGAWDENGPEDILRRLDGFLSACRPGRKVQRLALAETLQRDEARVSLEERAFLFAPR